MHHYSVWMLCMDSGKEKKNRKKKWNVTIPSAFVIIFCSTKISFLVKLKCVCVLKFFCHASNLFLCLVSIGCEPKKTVKSHIAQVKYRSQNNITEENRQICFGSNWNFVIVDTSICGVNRKIVCTSRTLLLLLFFLRSVPYRFGLFLENVVRVLWIVCGSKQQAASVWATKEQHSIENPRMWISVCERAHLCCAIRCIIHLINSIFVYSLTNELPFLWNHQCKFRSQCCNVNLGAICVVRIYRFMAKNNNNKRNILENCDTKDFECAKKQST